MKYTIRGIAISPPDGLPVIAAGLGYRTNNVEAVIKEKAMTEAFHAINAISDPECVSKEVDADSGFYPERFDLLPPLSRTADHGYLMPALIRARVSGLLMWPKEPVTTNFMLFLFQDTKLRNHLLVHVAKSAFVVA